jgi:Domain of unknown function (DUF4384)
MNGRILTTTKTVALAACMLFSASAFAKSTHDQNTTRDLLPEQRNLLAAVMKYITPASNTIHVKLSTDRHIYKIGEAMRIKVEMSRTAHVYLFDIGTSGKNYMLFPNRYHTSSLVRAHETIEIPGRHADWSLIVHGPTGHELIVAIASSKIMSPHERGQLLSQFKSGHAFVEVHRPARELVRDLVITHGKIERGEDSLTLRIVHSH